MAESPAAANKAAQDEAQAPYTKTLARLGRSVWLALESSYRADASRAADFEKRLDAVGAQVKQITDMGVPWMAIGDWSERQKWSDKDWRSFLRRWKYHVATVFNAETTTDEEKDLLHMFNRYFAFYACLPNRPEGKEGAPPEEGFETIQQVGKQVDRTLSSFEDRLGDPVEPCRACGKCALGRKLKRCTRCKQAFYCNQTCQKKDWRQHKRKCIPILEQDPKHVDKLVRTRYRVLCRQGKDGKEAMRMARAHYDQDKMDGASPDASTQVAAMFGLS
jgi:hypothetical protein